MGGWPGGWLDQLTIKPTQPLTKVGVGNGAELGKKNDNEINAK